MVGSRFPPNPETAVPYKMALNPPLHPPKKTAAGYFLATTASTVAPRIEWNTAGKWIITEEWSKWADTTRAALLTELLSRPAWFSKPPRRDVLDPLFGPWSGRSMQGELQFFCKTPEAPGKPAGSGTATWGLDGLLMTSTGIAPIWSVHSYTENQQQDTISLFGDGDTVGGDSSDGDEREIQLEEIEEASPASGTLTQIRGREWEARKFLAKERVREARLKAQIADHMAAKEEARFYRQYGDLEDGESHFSDYDLTDAEASDSESASDM
jgi:hypothetical protein